jgi:hypothetical protein
VPATEEEIEAIARIAELHRPRGSSDHPWAGRSLADLLELTEYRRIRKELTEGQLERWLAARPQIVKRWVWWSEDKRTTCGFYLERLPRRGWHIVSLSSGPGAEYRTAKAAVAAYILRELDCWAGQPDVARVTT